MYGGGGAVSRLDAAGANVNRIFEIFERAW